MRRASSSTRSCCLHSKPIFCTNEVRQLNGKFIETLKCKGRTGGVSVHCDWLTVQCVRNHLPKTLYLHWWTWRKKIDFNALASTNGWLNDKIPTIKLTANKISIENYVKVKELSINVPLRYYKKRKIEGNRIQVLVLITLMLMDFNWNPFLIYFYLSRTPKVCAPGPKDLSFELLWH